MSQTTVTFSTFPLHPEIQNKLASSGFTTPTEIQRRAIPMLLEAHPIDFHGQAQTGTGKTLAFGIPLLHRIDRSKRITQALVLAPTRELAVQICESLKPLADAAGITIEAVYGGMSMEVQCQRLRRGVHIVIGTPGRINDHLRRKSLSLDNVKTLVLDEADIMLDLGFKDDIDTILEELPQEREIWLFSATVKSGIDDILRTHMTQPQSVRVSKEDVANYSTKHYYCVVPMHARLNALCRFIDCHTDFYGFVFCQTKMLTAEIAEQMLMRGYKIGALHGDMSQAQRNAIIRRFKAKEITLLVATDVAARGIDVANLTHVINFSFPNDQESYIHRAGRTGRAGKEGIAITFIGRHEMRDIRQMQSKYKLTITPIDVPSREMLLASRLQDLTTYLQDMCTKSVQPVQQVEDALAILDEQSLRSIVRGMVHEKFLVLSDDHDNYQSTPKLDERGGERSGDHAPAAEFMMNVGLDDQVSREDVAAYLTERGIAADKITKIRVLKRCTFVHSTPESLDECMGAVQNGTLGGRTVRATRVAAEQSGPRRFGNSGGRGGDRGHGRSGGYNRGGSSSRREHGGFSGERRDREQGGFSGERRGDREQGGFSGERRRHGGGNGGSYGSGASRSSHGFRSDRNSSSRSYRERVAQ